MHAGGRWGVLGLARRGSGPAPIVCTRAVTVQHIILASALIAVLQRFSEDPGFLVDVVHLHEPAAGGATERQQKSVNSLANVLWAVWGILYAELAGIVS